MTSKIRYSEARVEALPGLVTVAQATGLYRCSGQRDEVSGQETKELSSVGKVIAGELWSYAFPVLKGMLRDGLVASQLGQLGVHAPPLTEEQIEAIMRTEYHRDDLAGAMIDRALLRFLERVVIQKKWDPAKSSLTTHFVNACLLAYPDAVRKWIKERHQLTSDFDETGLVAVQHDTALMIQNRELVRAIVQRAPERVRPILTWLWRGYTITEIAEELKLNSSTIRSRLFEFRKSTVLPLVRSGWLQPPAGHVLQAPYHAKAGTR